jgi:hypothetical protein
MSKLTPITLRGEVLSSASYELYGEVDGSGLEAVYKTYNIEINNIQDQLTFDDSSREAGKFNGIDIASGYWISDLSGQIIVKIISIEEKTDTSIKCIVEDIDMQSYRLFGQNQFNLSQQIVIFAANQKGEAIIVNTAIFNTGAIDRIQSRFNVNESDDRFLFRHDVAPSIANGNVVTIDSLGNLVRLGASNAASAIPVGIVISSTRGGKDVYVKPFNNILTNADNPESLDNGVGTVYYTDSVNDGEITTTQVSGSRPIYLQIATATATEVIATDGTLPDSGDVVKINGIEVFDGATDSVADLDAWVSLINTFTNQTNVVAEEFIRYVSTNSNQNTLVYAGTDTSSDVLLLVKATGTTPSSFPTLNISDGTNDVDVVFNTADIIDVASSGFDAASITEIYSKIQTALSGSGVEIEVSLVDLTGAGAVGQGIKLETTEDTAEIILTDVIVDALTPTGSPLVGPGSCLGLNETTAALDNVLKLLRSSGGAIEITGSPISSGYINTGGITSSSNGKPPYVLFLEGVAEDASTTEVGVNTGLDKNLTSNVTSGNGSATGIEISYTPFADSDVAIRINGIEVNLGGNKLSDCYFSADNGVTAKPIADIEAGDELFWNGLIAQFELDSLDDIDVVYQANRIDL